MSDRSKMPERLLAHATICQKAASLCWNEAVAVELEKLGEDCRQTALACGPDLIRAAWPERNQHVAFGPIGDA